MLAEITEQPAMFARILDQQPAAIRDVAAVIAQAQPRFVLLAARGTSDHAALYAKYLIEIQLGLPVGLASPSTMTQYGARPDLRDVLVIAVSQSGFCGADVEPDPRRRLFEPVFDKGQNAAVIPPNGR